MVPLRSEARDMVPFQLEARDMVPLQSEARQLIWYPASDIVSDMVHTMYRGVCLAGSQIYNVILDFIM